MPFLHTLKTATNSIWKRPPNQMENVFNNLYEKSLWGGRESLSGSGSDPENTQTLISELPVAFDLLKVRSILDIPCGDFFWLQKVNLSGVRYVGADIVRNIVARNQKLYGNRHRKFLQLDLVRDSLPRVDLVFCRDCLVHLSNDEALKALNNIACSQSKWLMATTFTDRDNTEDIDAGWWRPINLEKPPFSLPSPRFILNEKYNGDGGKYFDKSLGCWSIEEISMNL